MTTTKKTTRKKPTSEQDKLRSLHEKVDRIEAKLDQIAKHLETTET